MEKSHNEEESKKCCPGGHCGIKVIAAIVLILLGWICGYLMGSGGGWCLKTQFMCNHKGAGAMVDCPMMTPSDPAPAKK